MHSIQIGKRLFPLEQNTYIMGILNVTPDSFSDGGAHNTVDKALYHVEKMLADGCDIVDIGGESTRPGYEQVSVKEECERVLPVLEAIKARFDVPISLDTYKYEVAQAGILAGADMINDIWGLQYDNGEMAQVIAKYKVAYCLMHNRKHMQYDSLLQDMLQDFRNSIQIAQNAGIEKNKIILDPGIGFAKTYEQNLEVLQNLEKFHCLGYPLLLGASRKSVIGLTLDLSKEEREEGTLVTTAKAVWAGYHFVRVHDCKANKRAICMAQAIC